MPSIKKSEKSESGYADEAFESVDGKKTEVESIVEKPKKKSIDKKVQKKSIPFNDSDREESDGDDQVKLAKFSKSFKTTKSTEEAEKPTKASDKPAYVFDTDAVELAKDMNTRFRNPMRGCKSRVDLKNLFVDLYKSKHPELSDEDLVGLFSKVLYALCKHDDLRICKVFNNTNGKGQLIEWRQPKSRVGEQSNYKPRNQGYRDDRYGSAAAGGGDYYKKSYPPRSHSQQSNRPHFQQRPHHQQRDRDTRQAPRNQHQDNRRVDELQNALAEQGKQLSKLMEIMMAQK